MGGGLYLSKLLHVYFNREKGRSTQFKISALEERDDSDDAAYWEKYPGVIPEKQERLWDALIDAFEKYR